MYAAKAIRRWRKRRERRQEERLRTYGLVTAVEMRPIGVPFPVDAEHPPADFDG